MCDGKQFAKSLNKGGPQISFSYENKAGVDVAVYWIDGSGRASFRGVAGAGDQPTEMGTFPGHVFSFKTVDQEVLLASYMAGTDGENVVITSCGRKFEAAKVDTSRHAEFEALASTTPLVCEGEDSSKWSCVRTVSPAEVKARNIDDFGFHKDDLPNDARRTVGQQVDWDYGLDTIKYVVNVSSYDKGYLKMNMTNRLKEILYPWYNDRKKDSMIKHEHIGECDHVAQCCRT